MRNFMKQLDKTIITAIQDQIRKEKITPQKLYFQEIYRDFLASERFKKRLRQDPQRYKNVIKKYMNVTKHEIIPITFNFDQSLLLKWLDIYKNTF